MAFKSLSEERGPLSQGGNSILVDGQPIGYLRILQQDEFDEFDYPVYEGRLTHSLTTLLVLGICVILLRRIEYWPG